MPIEIFELVIKAKVADQNNSNAGNNPSAGSSASTPNSNPQLPAIEKSVQEILDILKQKSER